MVKTADVPITPATQCPELVALDRRLAELETRKAEIESAIRKAQADLETARSSSKPADLLDLSRPMRPIGENLPINGLQDRYARLRSDLHATEQATHTLQAERQGRLIQAARAALEEARKEHARLVEGMCATVHQLLELGRQERALFDQVEKAGFAIGHLSSCGGPLAPNIADPGALQAWADWLAYHKMLPTRWKCLQDITYLEKRR